MEISDPSLELLRCQREDPLPSLVQSEEAPE